MRSARAMHGVAAEGDVVGSYTSDDGPRGGYMTASSSVQRLGQ